MAYHPYHFVGEVLLHPIYIYIYIYTSWQPVLRYGEYVFMKLN